MPAASPRRNADPEQQERALRDLRLIEAFRAGRNDAFDELVRSYDPHVRRVLIQLNAPPSDIEDLLQDVFLRIFRNLGRFRGQSSFYTWLYRITVNVFFDHNKKRKRADVRLARLQSALSEVSLREPSDDPYVACSDTLAREEFSQAINSLPEAFRTIVAMREVEDLSYEEIALQASRARARLKVLLGPSLAAA
jgi:RNA polymerase sigma-70 factor (ECF subfamily)